MQLLDTRNDFLLPEGTHLKGVPALFLDSRARLRDPSLPAEGGLPAPKQKRVAIWFSLSVTVRAKSGLNLSAFRKIPADS